MVLKLFLFGLWAQTLILDGMKTIAVTVTGRVQGVWFRASTKAEAERLGITGYVCNQPDGTVYMEATGSAAQLDSLVRWCREGPRHARVDHVDVKEAVFTAYNSFDIRR
jgi:acylphosphatase